MRLIQSHYVKINFVQALNIENIEKKGEIKWNIYKHPRLT